ncbi:MAG: helix-turn-helix transcriptional regulator [Acidobacteria bacterium]|nr:helix-turn-helix transcriptional regulator [Acidobacteriota bacterium]MBI3473136.1 helix-turn-helix transcriptional regulator [Candidatus Solibacter usitatus]
MQAGQRLKQERERLNLTTRDVEEASRTIAHRHGNDDFNVGLSRLSEIENKGAVPSIFRLYSLCAIYRLDVADVLTWYGVSGAALAADAAAIGIERTHMIRFKASTEADVQLPLALDPGMDLTRTTYLSRLIQRWGHIPLALLSGIELKRHRYGFIGTDDWAMHPILPPGSLVLIDETQTKIAESGWHTEHERPIYFLEHRNGYECRWCSVVRNRLVLQPHPSSLCPPLSFVYPDEIDVIGQVIGVAMQLDQAGKHHTGF